MLAADGRNPVIGVSVMPATQQVSSSRTLILDQDLEILTSFSTFPLLSGGCTRKGSGVLLSYRGATIHVLDYRRRTTTTTDLTKVLGAGDQVNVLDYSSSCELLVQRIDRSLDTQWSLWKIGLEPSKDDLPSITLSSRAVPRFGPYGNQVILEEVIVDFLDEYAAREIRYTGNVKLRSFITGDPVKSYPLPPGTKVAGTFCNDTQGIAVSESTLMLLNLQTGTTTVGSAPLKDIRGLAWLR